MTQDRQDGVAVPTPRAGSGPPGVGPPHGGLAAGGTRSTRPPRRSLAASTPKRLADVVLLRERLEQRLRQQAAVAALGQLALRDGDFQGVVDEALQCIVRTLDVVMASVIRRCDDGLVVLGAHGWTPDGVTIDPATSIAGQVIAGGRHLVIPDLHTCSDPMLQRMVLGGGGRSSVILPIGDPAHPWGVLSAHAPTPAAFSDEDLHFLAAIGNVIVAAAVRAEADLELAYRAAHDSLTGLPNRDLLRCELARALGSADGRRTVTALLLIDLDDFKDVNDSLGHRVGDDVLREVATRLRGRARENDLVVRLGGDEFAVVLAGLSSGEQARSVATMLVGLLRDPIATSGGTVCLGGSIGVALAPEHADDPDTLLRRADLAMYRAKRERSGVAFYDPEVEQRASDRLRLVGDLRAAIRAEQITLAFQPVVDLNTREVSSVEALARWVHPVLGPQSPTDFVALAEGSGLVGDLTDLVLRTAARQCADWLARGRRLAVGVNLPPSLMTTTGYADHLRRITSAAGMPFDLLRAEVTEQALGSDATVAVLHRIHALGARVAIDDFGSGWSSLGRLKQLPVQTLKIDRSFITEILDDHRDVAIVAAVVALADQLGMRTIAEGIETAEVADLLAALGVLRGQGYLFARPLPAAELAEWHDAWLAGDHPWLRRAAAP